MTTRSTPEDYRIAATALAYSVRQISDIVSSSTALDASKKVKDIRDRISEAQLLLRDAVEDIRNMADELEAAKKLRQRKAKAAKKAAL
jgi:signal transduction histidine kinase